jgi:hypothetical protein
VQPDYGILDKLNSACVGVRQKVKKEIRTEAEEVKQSIAHPVYIPVVCEPVDSLHDNPFVGYWLGLLKASNYYFEWL